MAIITWTRRAKCKDCKWLRAFYSGNRKRHICSNAISPNFNSPIRLNDLVCDVWEIN